MGINTLTCYKTLAAWDSNRQPLRHLGYLAAGLLSLLQLRPKSGLPVPRPLGGVILAYFFAPAAIFVLAFVLGQSEALLRALGPLTLERAIYGFTGLLILNRYLVGRRLVRQYVVDHAQVRLSK